MDRSALAKYKADMQFRSNSVAVNYALEFDFQNDRVNNSYYSIVDGNLTKELIHDRAD
jgi:Neuraminidase (sialidase)